MKPGGVEPVANGSFGNPVLVAFDVTGDASFLGVDGAVGLGAELDDAKDVHLAAAFDLRRVAVVGEVVFIGGGAGRVESAGIPVAAIAGGLGAEVDQMPNLASRSEAGVPGSFSEWIPRSVRRARG